MTKIPFSLDFHTAVTAAVSEYFDEHPSYIIHPDQPLLQNFQTSKAFVEYRIGVDFFMSLSQVKVDMSPKHKEPMVIYQHPRPSQPVDPRHTPWTSYISKSNKLFWPESDRPSGFEKKLKAFFGLAKFPTYAFD